MTLTYLCTLDLPDSWFDELAARVPGVRVLRRREAEDPADLAEVQLLHTGDWFPDAASLPSLRLVQLDTSGVDHVRGTTLWSTGVPIATLGGIAPVPMAEFTMMAVLELAHRMPVVDQLRATRTWPTTAERLARLTPRSLHGRTMGIIGYGRIGRETARLARAFGMDVVGVRRTAAEAALQRFDGGRGDRATDATEVVALDRLDEVLGRSDVLVVVVPLTELTRGLLGARELALLPEDALVVNAARGGILDEGALRDSLRSGHIGGAVLDVFDDEPLPPDSPWWSEPNVLVTPHIAGLAPLYREQVLELVVENLTRLAEGRPLLNEVDRAAGY